jgi:hypothetical protein
MGLYVAISASSALHHFSGTAFHVHSKVYLINSIWAWMAFVLNSALSISMLVFMRFVNLTHLSVLYFPHLFTTQKEADI